MAQYDLIIKNATVVRPHQRNLSVRDIAIKNGKIMAVASKLGAASASAVFKADGLMAFPGAIDPHTHIGIYQHPSVDAPTETMSAVSGGVTTMLTYVRTGSLYLNRPGPLQTFFPELLAASEGRHYCDYGYHISPISGDQIGQMEYAALEAGCPNFGEVFMFYGSHGLHGRSDSQSKWLMLNEGDHYDLAHYDQICREAARIAARHKKLAPYVQVSFHCEVPELLRAYETQVRADPAMRKQSRLAQYSAARPDHGEAMAINIVGSMAHAAGLKKVNILHITSQAAMEAALNCRKIYHDVDFGLEVTAAHLALDTDSPADVWGKVNPPIRSKLDREFLWTKMLDGTIQWVITDHANCPRDMKLDASDPGDIWKAKAGFGGTEYMLPFVFSEGSRRGLTPNRIAELTSANAAARFGLHGKGDIAEGFDADIALIDPNEKWTIHAADSFSTQGYTPFEGLKLKGRVKATFVRGSKQFENGKITGAPAGKYLKRPGR